MKHSSLASASRASRVLLVLLFSLCALSAGAASAAVSPGWLRADIPATGSYYWRYVPASLDASRPAPVILFLHGSQGTPDLYKPYVVDAAEKAGCVVAMPKSSADSGWGLGNDEQTVAETLRLVRAELPVDPLRVALAGHSAGGAYAYLLAYAGSAYSAVFTLSAPFYAVASLADASYKPPIHMWYGTLDQNYTGALPSLEAQWTRLGVPFEEDIQTGFSHNVWPNSAMAAGFVFAVGKEPSRSQHHLHADRHQPLPPGGALLASRRRGTPTAPRGPARRCPAPAPRRPRGCSGSSAPTTGS